MARAHREGRGRSIRTLGLNGARRVLIVIPRMAVGGSEKMLTTLAGNLNRDRFDVHLAILSGAKASEHAFVPQHIALHELGAPRIRYAAISLLELIWKLRPGVVLAAGGPTGVLAVSLATLMPRGTRVIVRQGTMPSSSATRQKWWQRNAFRWSQRHAHELICQSEAMVHEVVSVSGVKPEKVRLLYNPVEMPPPPIVELGAKINSLRFLAVARLAPEKRMELIIRAFAVAKHQLKDATLTIVGDGSSRPALERLADTKVEDGSVRFVGYQADPATWMRNSDLLVMASEYEGLPNVALEALSVGLPVVAVACPGGIREIAGTTSRMTLVDEPTPEALGHCIVCAVANTEARELPAEAFWRRFGVVHVMKQYEEVLAK